MFDTIIVRYGGEIFLKSDYVRKNLCSLLGQQIRAKLRAKARVTRERIFVTGAEEDLKELDYVFGISSYSPSISCKNKIEDITETALRLGKKLFKGKKSFAVRAKKKEIEIELGSRIISEFGLEVDLDNPDQTIFVETYKDRAYVFSQKIKGRGGYPVGSQGNLLCLLSGGIDSPVAAYLMLKRGCRLTAVYFDSGSSINRKRTLKVAKILKKFGLRKLLIADHSTALGEFISKCERKVTCILCKRFMYRVVGRLAGRYRAKGMVTGESLGQVASQTLDNLAVLDSAAELPVYRPLIGLDKEEIISISRSAGLFDSSSSKGDPCTGVPKRPATKADIQSIISNEERLDYDSLLEKTEIREARI